MKKFVLVLYIIILLVLAIATFVEYGWGSEFVAEYIYHSPLFCLLWCILTLSALVIGHRIRMWHQISSGLLHLSFVVIFLGAGISFLTSKKGMLHLRIGQQTFRFMEQEEGLMLDLPFTLSLDTFYVEYYPDSETPSDYVSVVRCSVLNDGNQPVTISMNRVFDSQGYRFYQASYDEDERGTVLSVNYDPWGTGVTYAGYLLLALSMVYVLLNRSGKFRLLLRRPVFGVVLVVCLLLGGCLFYWCVGRRAPLIPVLNSPLLYVHVSLIMISYTLLAIMLLNGILAFCLPRKAHGLMMLSRMLLYPAVFLLGLGIFIGAIWANVSWGRYWAWDPKEVWALITFMVYALPFHTKSLVCFQRPTFFHLYMILAFLTVLMTYFGVNFFLGGMHSYA